VLYPCGLSRIVLFLVHVEDALLPWLSVLPFAFFNFLLTSPLPFYSSSC
jgi:hypothetical protein